MRLWRICKAKYADDRIGTGAKLAGGRWSSRGVAVLYFAATKSLAALEVFVHLDPEDLPESLSAISVDVPGTLFERRARRTVGELPPTWRHYPVPTALQAIGDAWVKAATSAILEVPSAIIPEESNYLLDPNHPAFKTVSWNDPEPFALDPRLWRRT
ncbi:MAG TPA: RES family NAD+ phosphorylase [Myxococcaceae bacterium]|nr:RES family NAD+ phosphorylase [Myxococcaceae bacterium]